MKKVKTLFMAIFAFAIVYSIVSCSNNESEESGNKKVDNTVWSSGDIALHSSAMAAIDKTETNAAIESKMNQAVGLQYTKETKSEDGYWFWDLCEQNGHECDSSLTVSFSADRCVFNVKTTKAKAKASQTKTEDFYKFSEGSYIVRFGTSLYEGVNVYNYGVYRADGTLFIPLDGKGCVTYQTKYTYSNKEIYNEDINEYNISASYSILDNIIIFQYTKDGKKISFEGLLSADEKRISISSNPIVNSVKILTIEQAK